VKNQGNCGSCWAFSAAAVIEGQWARKFGKSINVSAANLNDCTYSADQDGCQGGWMSDAIEYAALEGVENATAYPVAYPFIYAQNKNQNNNLNVPLFAF
jgi:cathepsin S